MRRRRWLTATLVGLLLPAAAWADEEFDKLSQEFEAAQTKFWDEFKAQQEKGEKPALNMNEEPAPVREFRPRFKALAEKRAGTPAAIAPLVWLVENERPMMLTGATEPAKDSDATRALQTLVDKHAADESIAEHIESLRYAKYTVGEAALRRLFDAVQAKNPSPEAKAWATFSIGAMLYEPFMFEMPGDAEGGAKRDPKDRDRAIETLRSVLKEFPGTKGAGQAEPYIYELEKLQVGMLAPDFEGTDLAGKTIKLSDFRGKVVVLDFWGFW